MTMPVTNAARRAATKCRAVRLHRLTLRRRGAMSRARLNAVDQPTPVNEQYGKVNETLVRHSPTILTHTNVPTCPVTRTPKPALLTHLPRLCRYHTRYVFTGEKTRPRLHFPKRTTSDHCFGYREPTLGLISGNPEFNSCQAAFCSSITLFSRNVGRAAGLDE